MPEHTGYKLAVDIGGTFTDVALATNAPEGTVAATTKILTTHEDPASAVLVGIQQVLSEAAVQPGQISLVLHGTTLATNALIERRGAKTALFTTQGHRDALEMAFENRFEQYDVNIDRPTPLVSRNLRIGIPQRMAADGSILIDLDETAVLEAASQLRTDNGEMAIESIAIGYLHSFRNPDHEQKTEELLRKALPGVSLSLSCEVCPEIREFERLSTTCANAYVKPLMSRYLQRLEQGIRNAGMRAPILLMTSGGGLTTLETAAQFPIRLVESGPAGGAILAADLARKHRSIKTGAALDSVLSFDMGGTTAKICLIDDGRPQLSRAFEVDRVYRFKKGSGLPVRIPVIEMVEIGAGGGSIASVDKLGRVQVGPRSAGSEPGPAAYGNGGTEPTVTDADFLLGYIDADTFAAGRVHLDQQAAEIAMQSRLADKMALDVPLAAFAISEVVDENMAAAARAHAAEWGRNLSQRTLIAFGGAAPLHAARLADKLNIDHIIVPRDAGVGSAIGFLLAPISFEVVRSDFTKLSDLDNTYTAAILENMLHEAAAVVTSAADTSAMTLRVNAYMRYAGQGYEIAVSVLDHSLQLSTEAPAKNPRVTEALDSDALQQQFEAEYTRLYGRTVPGLEVEILSWTLNLATQLEDVLPATATSGAPEAQDQSAAMAIATDRIAQCFDVQRSDEADRYREVAVYAREQLLPGIDVPGPALINEPQTTTLVPPHFRVFCNAAGHLELHRNAQP